MPSLERSASINDYQNFVRYVYGKPNDLHFDSSDMVANVQRFAMRALKGVRKNNKKKTRINILISLSWFMSLLNRLHIDLEGGVWNRFPYKCSYCGSCPCSCKAEKIAQRKIVKADDSKKPTTLEGFQEMFESIYPAKSRTLEHAGVHLAEEIGEFAEAFLSYKGAHDDAYLKNISEEATDVFACFMGVCNSYGINVAEELSKIFYENCHECNKTPCECSFQTVINYSS